MNAIGNYLTEIQIREVIQIENLKLYELGEIEMKHIENIVIGQPLIKPSEMFSTNIEDWNSNESDKTYYTNERYLPRILVDLGIYPSVSEIRRNKPELVCTLDKLDFLTIRPKKKIPLWILVGE